MTFRLKFSITKGWHFLFRSKYLLIVTIFISGSKYYEHSSTIYTTVHHPPPILANLSPNDKHQWMLSYWVVVNTLYKSTLSTLNDALIQDIHAWNLVAPLSPCFSEFKLTLLLCQFLISADVSFIFFFFFFWPVFPLLPLADLLRALQLSLPSYGRLIPADLCCRRGLLWLSPEVTPLSSSRCPTMWFSGWQNWKKRLAPNYDQPEICGVTIKIGLSNFFTGMALLWWYMLTCK